MISDVLVEAAIGGVVVLSNITFGLIVNSMKDEIKNLNDEFVKFSDKCRDRHDDIPSKDDMRREVDRIDADVHCLKKMFNVIPIKQG